MSNETVTIEGAGGTPVTGRVVAVVDEEVVVTNDTVARANAAVAGKPITNVGTAVVRNTEALVPGAPAKPGEFFDDKHHHKKAHRRGHKAEIATVKTEEALLDDVARYRGQLVNTIDELHTRLSPKYQIEQLKHTWTQAGTDALAILKNEGSPVDETRKKKAEGIVKAGGALSGLIALRGLHKLVKHAKSRREVRKAVSKGMPQEHVELVGVVEGLDVPETLDVPGPLGIPDERKVAEGLKISEGLKFPAGLDFDQIVTDVAKAVD